MRSLPLVLALAGLAIASQAHAADRDLTRPLASETSNFGFSTGELTPKGQAQYYAIGGLLGGLSVGISDRIDVGVDIPVLPVVGRAYARVGIFSPTSPVQLTLGAGALISPIEDLLGAHFREVFTGTLALRTHRWNLHLTSAAARIGERLLAMQLLEGGASYSVNSSLALVGELALFGGYSDRGYGVDSAWLAVGLLGAKVMGKSYSFDIGGIAIAADGDVLPIPLPAIAFSKRF